MEPSGISYRCTQVKTCQYITCRDKDSTLKRQQAITGIKLHVKNTLQTWLFVLLHNLCYFRRELIGYIMSYTISDHLLQRIAACSGNMITAYYCMCKGEFWCKNFSLLPNDLITATQNHRAMFFTCFRISYINTLTRALYPNVIG